ncbi:hypothetical protein IIO_02015 [Bacillus cereus VD115]|nr:hypothetical protein IIO_02015 [Bacillus cereus VD115]
MPLRIFDSRLNEDDEVKIEPAANLQQESIIAIKTSTELK